MAKPIVDDPEVPKVENLDLGAKEVGKATSPPDLLYSDKDLQAILDKYEEERRRLLEEEIKKASQRLGLIPAEQSVAAYVNANRELIKTHAPHIFEKFVGINKAEHEEMQAKGGYKSINFTKGTPASLDILGKDNKPIYTLNYHPDGDLVIAEVPTHIPKGPMHLSLALQDKNGENIEADKAAYFNISYGADGKIKSMNYPEPIEFEGDRCKFVIDGEPYYLKVSKTILDGLNAELAQNRGQAKKRAQDVGVSEQGEDRLEQNPQVQPQPLVHAPASPFIAPSSALDPQPAPPAQSPAVMKLGGKVGGNVNRDEMAIDLQDARKKLKKTNLINEKGDWIKPSAAQSVPQAPIVPQRLHEQPVRVPATPAIVSGRPAAALHTPDKKNQGKPMKLGGKDSVSDKPTLQDMNTEAMAKAAAMAARRNANPAKAIPVPAASPIPTPIGFSVPQPQEPAHVSQQGKKLKPISVPPASDVEMPQELYGVAKGVAESLTRMFKTEQRTISAAESPLAPPNHTPEEEKAARALYEANNNGKRLDGTDLAQAIEDYRALQATLKERTEAQASGRPSGSFVLDEEEKVANTPPALARSSLLQSIEAGTKLRHVPEGEKRDSSDPLFRHARGELNPANARSDEERQILARREDIDKDKTPNKPATPSMEPVRRFTPPRKTVPQTVQSSQPGSPPTRASTTPSSTPLGNPQNERREPRR